MDYMGLRWYKCDFHLHTMTSSCYKKKATDTAEMWVEEVVHKGLQCVAITDHNDYRGIDSIKAKCKERGIIAFPGVELSCDSSKIHLLVIFDVDKSGEVVQEFLYHVGIFNESLGKSEDTCNGDIFSVCKKAHDRGALVIAAHIDEFNGICEISHSNLEKVLNREYIDAVQVANEEIWLSCNTWPERCEKLTEKYGREITSERAKKWYKAFELAKKSELPSLTFSDNPYSETDSRHGLWGIGRVYTWLKMNQSPNLESVRQALLSFDMRIKKKDDCNSQPDLMPELWIRRFSFDNTSLNNKKEVVVNFNPQLNTIIGGRGSGKSSVIRLLAGGLESFDAEDLSVIKEEQDSFYKVRGKDKRGVYKGVFGKNSVLRIYAERFGDSYKLEIQNVERMHSQKRELYRLENGEWKIINDRNYLSFFKVQVYTQKQIYEIASDSNSLLSIIDGDISQFNQLITDRDVAFNNVIANYLKIMDLKESIRGEEKIRTELNDINEQISKYEKSGISEALKEKQKFDTQVKTIEGYLSEKNEQIEKIRLVVDEVEKEMPSLPEMLSDELKLLLEEDLKEYASFLKSMHQIIDSVHRKNSEFREMLDGTQWSESKKRSEQRYLDVIRTLKEQGFDFNKLDDLLDSKKEKEKELDKIGVDKKKLIVAEQEHKELCNKYDEYVTSISENRRSFIQSVIGNDSNVKFEVQRRRNRSSFTQMMKSVLGKDNATVDEGVEKLADTYFGKGGIEKFKILVQDIRKKTDKNSLSAYMRNAIVNLQPESFARMFYYIPDDDLRVSYKPENSRSYIPLSSASAGQKTTAILTFLLAYGDSPLLLDQPEDDLDNKLVYDLIVARLKKAKSKRQIIVVTHNANIPVNADAEYIISMNSESDKVDVKYEGTMDDLSVRKEICDVMEGTQFAFEMRAKKYHFRIVE